MRSLREEVYLLPWKINFLEEVVKAGLAEPQRIIRALKGGQ